MLGLVVTILLFGNQDFDSCYRCSMVLTNITQVDEWICFHYVHLYLRCNTSEQHSQIYMIDFFLLHFVDVIILVG